MQSRPSSDDRAPAARPQGGAAALARDAGVAVWKQIESRLAGEIRDRIYAGHDRLPSEAALAARFGVNRHTLRRAIGALQDAGLVRVEQGRGAFIQHQLVDYALGRRVRFSENIRRNRLLPGKQLLAAREIVAPDHVAKALQLRRGAVVLMAEWLDEASGDPIGLAVMYLPAARFPGLIGRLAVGRPNPRITEILRGFGVADYLRARSRVTTQMPSEAVSRLLRQPRTRPVLCVESIDTDLDGVPIKYGETTFSGDRVQLVFEPDAA